ncbi:MULTISPECIES: methyltransferase domain-containing protein [Sphingobacterium]|uniref:Methyltransferase domain-containing protein n=1 Tax=Sphingobacterium tenebrionis TaxID=3111775 RepID=A0ABU8I4Y8_9SPHI|nr:methyltransferase domain-containing protein [Sphingobacterium sp. CZ-2]QBR11538.1 methyltransferase domain-containing protein [Sphingobacterium sp. CZ-2]
MPWNPEIYNQFKDIRYQPFFDLMDLIEERTEMQAVDLGCGTGEQTAMLAERFQQSTFLGIDSSVEMLRGAEEHQTERLYYKVETFEEFINRLSRWDLIFSNAALQWSGDHHTLFPDLIKKLNPGGQLAVQMPCQTENELNQILFELANEEPYRDQLNGWNRSSPVLSMEEYTEMFIAEGMVNLKISKRIYPIVAEDTETLFHFISGSALIPYMERLSEEQQIEFNGEFKRRIGERFEKRPVVYPFRRLLLYGVKA